MCHTHDAQPIVHYVALVVVNATFLTVTGSLGQCDADVMDTRIAAHSEN